MLEPKLCECGCGQPAPLALRTSSKRGHVKGQPVRFIMGHARRGRRAKRVWSIEDRGFSTPCWIWQGMLNEKGYGRDYFRGRWTRAHISVYTEQIGEVPSGLQLDHLCRNRSCVNPAHLEPVTQAVNQQRGDKAKLTSEDVAQIRASHETASALALRFGVSVGHVRRLRSGQFWQQAA